MLLPDEWVLVRAEHTSPLKESNSDLDLVSLNLQLYSKLGSSTRVTSLYSLTSTFRYQLCDSIYKCLCKKDLKKNRKIYKKVTIL